MDPIQERAHELGRLLSQTGEFKALKRANQHLSDDREAVTMLNRLNSLQEAVAMALHSGAEPTDEQQQEYEGLLEQVQQRSVYQAVVAAQANFDRLMVRVNEEIANGIEAGDRSRIILPS